MFQLLVHDIIRANPMKKFYKQPANETVTDRQWSEDEQNNYMQSQPQVYVVPQKQHKKIVGWNTLWSNEYKNCMFTAIHPVTEKHTNKW